MRNLKYNWNKSKLCQTNLIHLLTNIRIPNYPYLSKRRFKNYLKKIFSKLSSQTKLLYLRRFQIIYKSLILLSLINIIKDLYTNKTYKKNRLVVYTYNDKKKSHTNAFIKIIRSQLGYWFLLYCYYLR